jgi:hypothetical protein
MHSQRNRTKWLSCAVAAAALLAGTAAFAVNGAGSLIVTGASCTPTHWNIPIGVATTAQICGVTTAEAGSPLPASLTVWVKSSQWGNTQLTATLVDASAGCYEFTYTPPAIANGDDFDACGTTIVAYESLGMNANNDICDDGLDNGSGGSASGFRFLDSSGAPIDCVSVGVDQAPWSQVKGLYR